MASRQIFRSTSRFAASDFATVVQRSTVEKLSISAGSARAGLHNSGVALI